MPTLGIRLVRWAFFVALLTLILFALSGRWDQPALWGIVALLALFAFATFVLADPSLPRERFRPPEKGADPIGVALIRLSALVMIVVAVLDSSQFHWSGAGAGVRVFGFVFLAIALVLVGWAMVVNPFFSTVIRIQSDRGHRVIARGPYQWVRHPGYLGMVVAIPSIPLALGSWWGLAPGIVYSLLICRRAFVEDRFLQERLPGYDEYSQRVPNRLVPGLV